MNEKSEILKQEDKDNLRGTYVHTRNYIRQEQTNLRDIAIRRERKQSR